MTFDYQEFELDRQVAEDVYGIANQDIARVFSIHCAAIFILASKYKNDKAQDIYSILSDNSRESLRTLSLELNHDDRIMDLIVKCWQLVQRGGIEQLAADCHDNIFVSMEGLSSTQHPYQDNFGLSFHFEKSEDVDRVYIRSKLSGRGPQFGCRVFQHFQALLKAMVANLTSKVETLRFLPESEEHLILTEFNRPIGAEPGMLVHRSFEQCVERFPNHIAIVGTNERWTYRDLNERANQLAWFLQGNGLPLGAHVAIMMDRSPELIVCVMATLKAGCVYLPLDATFPNGRLQRMCNIAEPAILLTDCADKLGDFFNGPAITIGQEFWQDLSTEKTDNPDLPIRSDDVAYSIFTSGSTGQPKGVQVRHYNLINMLTSQQADFPIRQGDVFLAKNSPTFDVSIHELLGWFWEGGAIGILEKDLERDPAEIIHAIDRLSVTHICFIPSLFRLVLEEADKNPAFTFPSLKYVFFAGDVLSADIVQKFSRLKLSAKLVNFYGPTETAIYCSQYLVPDDLVELPPIGKPMKGVELLVLDENECLCPIGVPGELYVGGYGVAKGYLKDPGHTSERFRACSLMQNRIFYKTGDRVYWRTDGNLVFVERVDQQVKVRGRRIELGEIESVLANIDGVIECIVVPKKEEQKQTNSLTCFYQIRLGHGIEITPAKLITRLKEELPDYMVPNRFQQIQVFPRTASGKIDRRALQDLAAAPPSESGRYSQLQEPLSQTQRKIQEQFRAILELEEVKIDDDFFELGGTSLNAISLASRLSKDFNIRVADVFRDRTIRTLAANLPQKEQRHHDKVQELYERIIALLTSAECNSVDDKTSAFGRSEAVADFTMENRSVRHVLLTGATGYLGIYLLRELLSDVNLTVSLLVRASTISSARTRLQSQWEYYFPHAVLSWERINVLCGDLHDISMAIPDTDFAAFDAIVHSAGDVKHAGDFKDFYRTNVLPTQELLEKALTFSIAFHYVSTTSVYAGVESQNLVEDIIQFESSTDNPYILSKMAAEDLISEYVRKGADATIYRVGTLVFDSETGRFQKNIEENAFYSLMRVLLSLKVLPESMDREIEMTPVDHAAKAISLLTKVKRSEIRVYHIFNPNPMSLRRFAELSPHSDSRFQTLPRDRFRKYFLDAMTQHDPVEIERLSFFLQNSQSTRTGKLNHSMSAAILHNLGFTWRPISNADLERMIQHMKSIEFLK